jgi:5-methyltetrahydrofolate--homocysteine methyltransferase
MDPPSSVCGAVIGGKGVKYFTVNAVSQTQLSQYAKRKGMSESYLASFLGDMGY